MKRSENRSLSFEPKNLQQSLNMSVNQSNSKQKRSFSLQQSFQQQKLPLIQIKKVMKKIGAAEKFSDSFSPTDQQRTAFRKSKWQQLRQQYSTRKTKKQPFDYELDEIVLDCWDYGENYGRKTIWRKYKQKFDELTFDTLRVVHKKKI